MGAEEIADVLECEDERALCPVDSCGWWVPAGMEYLFVEHFDEHGERFRDRLDRDDSA